MSLEPRSTYSFDDYLTTERTLMDERHEYIDGQVFAMTGSSWEHNVITANLTAELHTRLKQGPCTVLSNDLRVRIETANAGTYPDIAVLCEAPAFYDDRRDTVTNPTLLIEVLSPSSEGYDRGTKFACYRTLPSLRQYVLVAQDRVAVDVLTRESDGRWVISSFDRLDQEVPFESLGCTLPMAEIYARIRFPTKDA